MLSLYAFACDSPNVSHLPPWLFYRNMAGLPHHPSPNALKAQKHGYLHFVPSTDLHTGGYFGPCRGLTVVRYPYNNSSIEENLQGLLQTLYKVSAKLCDDLWHKLSMSLLQGQIPTCVQFLQRYKIKSSRPVECGACTKCMIPYRVIKGCISISVSVVLKKQCYSL